MSRSRQHAPVVSNTTGRSERWDKRFWHRTFRARVRTAIASGRDAEIDIKSVSDPWNMSKDGKGWQTKMRKEWMRK